MPSEKESSGTVAWQFTRKTQHDADECLQEAIGWQQTHGNCPKISRTPLGGGVGEPSSPQCLRITDIRIMTEGGTRKQKSSTISWGVLF